MTVYHHDVLTIQFPPNANPAEHLTHVLNSVGASGWRPVSMLASFQTPTTIVDSTNQPAETRYVELWLVQRSFRSVAERDRWAARRADERKSSSEVH